MSAFHNCQGVEAKGRIRLLPFLEERSGGRYVLTDKGRHARSLQETIGDALATVAGSLLTIEFKIEHRFTGNLFLETWSNRNLNAATSHAERGSNPGWMFKLRSDLLWYYFLETDQLFIVDFFELKRWAFGSLNRPPNIYKYTEIQQSKYSQANDTLGRLVPISDLKRELPGRTPLEFCGNGAGPFEPVDQISKILPLFGSLA